MEKLRIGEAVRKLTKELENDADFRYSYQANIAMAFKDEYARRKKDKKYLSKQDIHEISNIAANNFLALLCRKTKSIL